MGTVPRPKDSAERGKFLAALLIFHHDHGDVLEIDPVGGGLHRLYDLVQHILLHRPVRVGADGAVGKQGFHHFIHGKTSFYSRLFFFSQSEIFAFASPPPSFAIFVEIQIFQQFGVFAQRLDAG